MEILFRSIVLIAYKYILSGLPKTPSRMFSFLKHET